MDLVFVGTANGLENKQVAVFSVFDRTFRLDEQSLRARIENYNAQGNDTTVENAALAELIRLNQ